MAGIKMSSSTDKAHILIADDHPLFRTAMHQVLAEVYDGPEIIEASDLEEAEQVTAAHELDLILLDLNMPGVNGFCGLVQLRNEVPNVPIVVVSANEDKAVAHEAITYGAIGFIPKSSNKAAMVKALEQVIAGQVYIPSDTDAAPVRRKHAPSEKDQRFAEKVASLSPQQRVVLQMLIEGRPNKQIAYLLDITESTVKAHVSAILRKLDVQSRTQAVINAGKLSLPPLDPATVRGTNPA